MNAAGERAERIRVEGRVQGVGFRVHAWRLGQRYGLRGRVANVGAGVSIHACGPMSQLEAFVRALADDAPALARIDRIEREPAEVLPAGASFVIAE